jgi:hypothetical protein
MLDEILKRYNLKLEDLNAQERETLLTWAQKLQTKALTLEDVRDYVSRMAESIEREFDYDTPKEKDLMLKARLKNYILLRDFLLSPERARKIIEEALKNIKPK